MKKIKKTKEEKEEIRKYKKEEKELRKKTREQLKFRKEYAYILVAIVILIILIAFLIYFVFFNKKKTVIVPDAPEYDTLEASVINYNGDNASANDLNNLSTENIDVSYKIISDYYEKDILLSNTQVFYLNDSFIITSGPLSKDSFISSVTKDGNLNWINKLESKEYDDIYVYKVVYLDDNYYVVGISTENDKNNLIVLELSEKGSVITNRIIAENTDTKIKDVLVSNDNIAIITGDGTNINVYFTNSDLDEFKNNIIINDSITSVSKLNYTSGTFNSNNLKIISKNNQTYYITDINTNSYDVNSTELTGINELSSSSVNVGGYLNGFIVYNDNKLYKYDTSNKLINTYNYNNITLEDLTEYREKYKDNEYIDVDEFENSIYISSVSVNNNSIIVKSETLLSYIFDVYDENLKLSKRIVLDRVKYSYDEGVILKTYYIDGNIYEIYSYGTETPSIMISKIG